MKVRIKNPIYGVPITFLYHWNPDQFEIVEFRKGDDGKDLVFTLKKKREFNRTFVSLFDGDSWNDKKQRRENQWKDYLRENPNYEGEPIDYFFPIKIFGLMNNPKDTTISGKRKYARILIQKINENNTNENIS